MPGDVLGLQKLGKLSPFLPVKAKPHDYSIETWAGSTPGTLLKQEIKPLACNLKTKWDLRKTL